MLRNISRKSSPIFARKILHNFFYYKWNYFEPERKNEQMACKYSYKNLYSGYRYSNASYVGKECKIIEHYSIIGKKCSDGLLQNVSYILS